MKRMNNLKNVIAAKIMGGMVIGMTAVAGVAPVTVFAQSQEAECICEEKCSQDSINEECRTVTIANLKSGELKTIRDRRKNQI